MTASEPKRNQIKSAHFSGYLDRVFRRQREQLEQSVPWPPQHFCNTIFQAVSLAMILLTEHLPVALIYPSFVCGQLRRRLSSRRLHVVGKRICDSTTIGTQTPKHVCDSTAVRILSAIVFVLPRGCATFAVLRLRRIPSNTQKLSRVNLKKCA